MSDSITYTHHDNGIHQIHWAKTDNSAVNHYIEIFTELHATVPDDSTVLILHDYRDAGTPSFTTLANAMKNLELRDDLILRIAHLYSDLSYPMIMKNATMVARFDANRRFFQAHEEQLAIDWLLDHQRK